MGFGPRLVGRVGNLLPTRHSSPFAFHFSRFCMSLYRRNIIASTKEETATKRVIAVVAASLVVTLTVFGCGHYLPSDGWVTLIDGNTGLDNFNRLGGANWHAEDGAIQADKSTTQGSSVLVSKRLFKDFEVYAEFWADARPTAASTFVVPSLTM